jgi:hypothetical protein
MSSSSRRARSDGKMSAFVEPADGLGTAFGAVTIFLVFGAVTWVEPRGVEPLTSAVQRRYGLSGCVLACTRVWLRYGDFGRSSAYAFLLCSAPSCSGCCTG